MTDREILQQEFQLIKQDLIKKHNELKMKASGKWEQSLEVEVKDNKATLYGMHYTYQLQHGRTPGKMPPIQAIEDWIINKGIKPISEKMKTSTLAFLIARKIKQEGTKYFKQGGTDLIDSVVTPERIQKIINRIARVYISQFTSEIIDVLKKHAA